MKRIKTYTNVDENEHNEESEQIFRSAQQREANHA